MYCFNSTNHDSYFRSPFFNILLNFSVMVFWFMMATMVELECTMQAALILLPEKLQHFYPECALPLSYISHDFYCILEILSHVWNIFLWHFFYGTIDIVQYICQWQCTFTLEWLDTILLIWEEKCFQCFLDWWVAIS